MPNQFPQLVKYQTQGAEVFERDPGPTIGFDNVEVGFTVVESEDELVAQFEPDGNNPAVLCVFPLDMDPLGAIARRQLHVETLEWRGSDSLDFHDCGVLGIRRAMLEAYALGYAARDGKA